MADNPKIIIKKNTREKSFTQEKVREKKKERRHGNKGGEGEGRREGDKIIIATPCSEMSIN